MDEWMTWQYINSLFNCEVNNINDLNASVSQSICIGIVVVGQE